MGFGIFILILALTYLALMLGLWLQWEKLGGQKKVNSVDHSISVLIAMRNEAENIENLLTSLSKQHYKQSNIQIILVDDHSDDDSFALAKKFSTILPELKIIRQEQGLQGKKAALQTGLLHCTGEVILCTDSDCIPEENWLCTMSSQFNDKDLMMLSAPVLFHPKENFFHRWMALEFIALVASGAASFGSRFPLMCNGANIAYRRSALDATGGFGGRDGFESGDDIMRMLAIQKMFPNGLKFLKDKAGIVRTNAPQSIKAFIQQRIRWSSKTGKYFSFQILFYAAIVGAMNLLLFLALISCMFIPTIIPVFILLLLFKSLADFPLLKSSSRWAERPMLIYLLLPAEIINAFYVFFMFITAPFLNYSWKGRKMK